MGLGHFNEVNDNIDKIERNDAERNVDHTDKEYPSALENMKEKFSNMFDRMKNKTIEKVDADDGGNKAEISEDKIETQERLKPWELTPEQSRRYDEAVKEIYNKYWQKNTETSSENTENSTGTDELGPGEEGERTRWSDSAYERIHNREDDWER